MEKENKEEKRVIPFTKPVRIGNFKLWRSRFRMSITPTEADRERVFKESGGKKKAVSRSFDIEQLNVSELDGGWQIKIPATYEMFGMISQMYADGDDARIASILGNMMYVSAVGNGFFQRAVNICSMLYANPDTLKEDNPQHKDLVDDVHNLIGRFLDWRKLYDERMKENEPTEDDDRHEEMAEKAMDVLNNE